MTQASNVIDLKHGSPVGGILLAAGTSSRLGEAKQLLAFRDRPLVRFVADIALSSRLADLTVVIGNRADDVRAALQDLEVQLVENAAYVQGQSTSLRAGLVAFPAARAAAMILLVDQPFVDSMLINRLIGLYEDSGASIVAPHFAGRRGNPVIFDRSLFPELLTVVGDIGARDVIRHHRDRTVLLELPDERPFLDVDTWDDYQRVTSDKG